MFEWIVAGNGLNFMGIVHHDDGEREFAYDRWSLVYGLNRVLKDPGTRNWTVICMRKDWNKIFPD